MKEFKSTKEKILARIEYIQQRIPREKQPLKLIETALDLCAYDNDSMAMIQILGELMNVKIPDDKFKTKTI